MDLHRPVDDAPLAVRWRVGTVAVSAALFSVGTANTARATTATREPGNLSHVEPPAGSCFGQSVGRQPGGTTGLSSVPTAPLRYRTRHVTWTRTTELQGRPARPAAVCSGVKRRRNK